VTSDFLTLDITFVRLDWFSSTFFHLWFRWVFHTFDFCFISREKRYL